MGMMRSSWALVVVVVVLATSLAACGDGEPVSGGRAAPAERAPARAASDSSPRDVRIRPKRGIAGVLLEMSRAAVTQILGAADAVKPSELHTGWTQEIYGRRRLRVTSDELGSVWDVRTYSREQRAPGGVGVGSLARVAQRIRRRCSPWADTARR